MGGLLAALESRLPRLLSSQLLSCTKVSPRVSEMALCIHKFPWHCHHHCFLAKNFTARSSSGIPCGIVPLGLTSIFHHQPQNAPSSAWDGKRLRLIATPDLQVSCTSISHRLQRTFHSDHSTSAHQRPITAHITGAVSSHPSTSYNTDTIPLEVPRVHPSLSPKPNTAHVLEAPPSHPSTSYNADTGSTENPEVHSTPPQTVSTAHIAETASSQPSTSYTADTAPLEIPKIPSRTARRRARKKQAAPNPETLPIENELVDPSEWAGLDSWRGKEVDESRGLGKAGPEGGLRSEAEMKLVGNVVLADSLAGCGRLVLETAEPLLKCAITHAAFCAYKAGNLPIGEAAAPKAPARPERPVLVSPREVPPPKRSPLPLNAYMLHNLAHIELNAIDLAWDTLVRFSPLRTQLGERFFADFCQVAEDESRHLGWVLQRMGELGHSYGDMPAHDLLWRDAQKTCGDVTARLAVVPMVQEARGLDAGPRLVDRLNEMGDSRSAVIVRKIAEEELAHVAVGVTWFLHVCRRSGVDPGESFQGLIQEYCQDTLRGPFNHAARAEVGVPRHWYDASAPTPPNRERSSALESQQKLDAKRRESKVAIGELAPGTEKKPEAGGRVPGECAPSCSETDLGFESRSGGGVSEEVASERVSEAGESTSDSARSRVFSLNGGVELDSRSDVEGHTLSNQNGSQVESLVKGSLDRQNTEPSGDKLEPGAFLSQRERTAVEYWTKTSSCSDPSDAVTPSEAGWHGYTKTSGSVSDASLSAEVRGLVEDCPEGARSRDSKTSDFGSGASITMKGSVRVKQCSGEEARIQDGKTSVSGSGASVLAEVGGLTEECPGEKARCVDSKTDGVQFDGRGDGEPGNDALAFDQVRERLALLVAMEQERASA